LSLRGRGGRLNADEAIDDEVAPREAEDRDRCLDEVASPVECDVAEDSVPDLRPAYLVRDRRPRAVRARDRIEEDLGALRAVGGGVVATRDSTADPWSAPVNLGGAINQDAGETRPALSWDAQTLYLGRAPGPEGSSDIYVATRGKLNGSDG
jgi:hypothetical protein